MGKKEKILVVDDIPINYRIIGRFLQDDYDVVYASNGERALEIANSANPPDLILLDVIMPGLDGYEVCRRLKSNPKTTSIPVIFISAQAEVDDKLMGLKVGGADYITKPFEPAELVARVWTHLQLRRVNRQLMEANRQLAEKQERLDQELNTAAEIQSYLLPSETPSISGLEFAWEFLPSVELGGDLFNIMYLDSKHLGMYIIDVSGHGVPSALITFAIAQSLNPQGGIVLSNSGIGKDASFTVVAPARVLTELDRIYPVERFNKTFTIIYLVIDLETGCLTYANAGHPPALLIKRNGHINWLDMGGSIIGLGGLIPFEQEEIRLEAGDRLILYTDGLLEYHNSDHIMFGEDRLLQVLKNTKNLPLSSVIYALSWSLMEFGGNTPPQDDVTILAMECDDLCRTIDNGLEV